MVLSFALDFPCHSVVEAFAKRSPESLNLIGIGLKKIPAILQKLGNIRTLDLRFNSIESIDEWQSTFVNLKTIELAGNPVLNRDKMKKDNASLVRFFNGDSQEDLKLKDANVLFVGQEKSGKSTLRDMLCIVKTSTLRKSARCVFAVASNLTLEGALSSILFSRM